MNLWHDISPGEKIPEEINVIIEIPRGSNNKYEIDKDTGLIALDRVLYGAQTFPFDYGFVPQTHWHDGDALDVMVLTTNSLPVGVVVRARPVGIMHMIDTGEKDDKILAVPTKDPRWSGAKDLTDINPHTLKEIEHFYSTYKILEKKDVNVTGFEDRAAAHAAIKEGIELYKQKFGK